MRDIRLYQQTRPRRSRPTPGMTLYTEWLNWLATHHKKALLHCQEPPVTFKQWKAKRAAGLLRD